MDIRAFGQHPITGYALGGDVDTGPRSLTRAGNDWSDEESRAKQA